MVTTHVDDAVDNLDAVFFGGDSLHNPEAINFVETYISRWQKQIEVIKKANYFEESLTPGE